MKTIFLFVLLGFLNTANFYSQEQYRNDILLLKTYEGVSFVLSDAIIGEDTISHTGITAIDQLNNQFVCSEIKNMFTPNPDYGLERWFKFTFESPSNLDSLLYYYSQLTTYFEFVEAYGIPEVAYIPDDPLFEPIGHKSFYDMKLPEAWDIEQGNANTIVAVIDLGLDWNHPDISRENIFQNISGGSGYGEDFDHDGRTIEFDELGKKILDPGDLNGIDDDNNGYIDDLAGWDFVYDDPNVIPSGDPINNQHGLNIFGLIAATANNQEGACGVAFNSRVIHLMAGVNGFIYGDHIEAIYYAANMGAKVINMSYFGSYSQAAQDAVNYAHNVKGCVLVGAHGFTTTGCPENNRRYPATYDNVIGASVLNENATTMRLSAIVSDRVDILGSSAARYPYINANYDYDYAVTIHSSGTTALTSGLAALLFSHYPTWTNVQVENQIMMTCSSRDEFNRTNSCNFDFYGLIGHGLLDAYKALTFTGTIDEDLIWSHELYVFHDIVVNEGATLTLRPNTVLDFEPAKTFKVKGKLLIEGNLTVNTDIIIQGGGEIEVLPGANLIFEEDKSLIIKGEILSEGLSSNRIVYSFTSGSSGIKFKAGSSGSISYTDISGANSGITMIEAVANIRFTTISNCNFGIHIADQNLALGNEYIEYVTFTNNNFGLWLNNSSPFFLHNEITGSTKGVYCSNFSSPSLAQSYYTNADNHITDNTYGVYAYANSNPTLGHYDPYNPYNNYGFNTIINNTAYHLYAEQYCTIHAANNWWGSNPPNTALFYSGAGSMIDYYPWLTTPPSYNVQGEGKELKEQSQLADKDLEIDAPRIPIIVRLLNIRNLINSSRFREAFNLSKQVVSLFPDSALTNFALDLFWQAGKEYNIDSLTNNLTTIYNTSDRTLCGAAGLILSGYLGENRLAFLDEIKSRFSNSYIAELALYDKFTYYYFNIEDLESAGQMLAQLEAEFPESQSTLDAQMIYYNQGSNGNSSYSSLNKNNNTSEIELPKEYALLGNYPNPFNPNTNISYALPFESEVEIKIFDIMGREIKTFNLNGVSPGYHSILWDGLNNNGNQVSSGIYIYVFKARSLETIDQFTKSAKMIMLK